MQSKFQERLLSHAVTYFTETNTSLLAGQTVAGSAWNLATNLLWQQFQHAQGLYTGRHANHALYSHHGPNGLDRACELLKHFKVITEDNMNVLKNSLNHTGNERDISVRIALKGYVENEDKDDDSIAVITHKNTQEQETAQELPHFTQEDANHLLQFISKDADVLDSTFGQSVFAAAFSLLGVFPRDIESTQKSLNTKAQEPKPSSSNPPIKHSHRADCHLLYQKIMPWQTANATMQKSTTANSAAYNQNLHPTL